MSLLPVEEAFVVYFDIWLSWVLANNYKITFGDFQRSTDPLKCPDCQNLHSYQELLVYNGRSKNLYSLHLTCQASDFKLYDAAGNYITDGEAYRPLGERWEQITAGHGRWGGRFGVDPSAFAAKVGWDPGHIELDSIPGV